MLPSWNAAQLDEGELDGEVEEEDAPIASGEQVLLESIEAESDLYKEVVQLTDETLDLISKKKASSEAACEAVQAMPQPEQAPSADTAAQAEACIRHATDIAAHAGQVEASGLSCQARHRAGMCCQGREALHPHEVLHPGRQGGEGFAPKSCFDDEAANLNQHNLLQKQLAKARKEFELNTSRRSRLQLWMDFSAKCAAVATTSEQPEVPFSRVPQAFRPSCCLTENKERDYQIVCARQNTDDQLRLWIVQGVWRGAVRKGAATRAQEADEAALGSSASHCLQSHPSLHVDPC